MFYFFGSKFVKFDIQIYLIKQIFEKLDLGEIAPSDEDIFKEVADFDKDGVINLDDFRKILTYKPGEDRQNEIEGEELISQEGEEQM